MKGAYEKRGKYETREGKLLVQTKRKGKKKKKRKSKKDAKRKCE